MNYRKKYLKYKEKYLNLKQNGGAIEKVSIDLKYVQKKLKEKHNNYGQQNCGIIFVDNYVIKCLNFVTPIASALGVVLFENEDENEKYELEEAEEINNDLDGIIPKCYKWEDDKLIKYIKINEEKDKYAKCIIMEKLDTDLTSYIFKTSYKKYFNNLDNYESFYDKLVETYKTYTIDPEIKEITNKMKQYIFDLCHVLNRQIIFKHHELVKKGWHYIDLKMDNIGCKINNEIQLYFIDKESGLFKFNNSSFDDYLNLHAFNRNLGSYYILGEHNFRNMVDIEFNNFYPAFNKEILLQNLEYQEKCTIEEEKELFHWIKFTIKDKKFFIVIQFIMGFFRLVVFDDEGRHMSNPLFNKLFPEIDELFYSIRKLNKVFIDLIK